MCIGSPGLRCHLCKVRTLAWLINKARPLPAVRFWDSECNYRTIDAPSLPCFLCSLFKHLHLWGGVPIRLYSVMYSLLLNMVLPAFLHYWLPFQSTSQTPHVSLLQQPSFFYCAVVDPCSQRILCWNVLCEHAPLECRETLEVPYFFIESCLCCYCLIGQMRWWFCDSFLEHPVSSQALFPTPSVPSSLITTDNFTCHSHWARQCRLAPPCIIYWRSILLLSPFCRKRNWGLEIRTLAMPLLQNVLEIFHSLEGLFSCRRSKSSIQ